MKMFFDKYQVDAILVNDLYMIRYLCGYSGSNGALVVFPGKKENLFFTDSRYLLQAKQEVFDAKSFIYNKSDISLWECIADKLQEIQIEKIAFFADKISYGVYKIFSSLEFKITAIEEPAYLARMIKREDELQSMKKAIEISEASLRQLLEEFHTIFPIPPSEQELAARLNYSMFSRGAERLSFNTIVQVGKNSALIHGSPTKTKLYHGENLLIDYGMVYEGYCSDQTITFALGKLSYEKERMYNVVYKTLHMSIDAIRPGIKGKELCKRANEYIVKHGYPAMPHSLGHGIGVEAHECLSLNINTDIVLEPGMVFTIEPGIYIEGFGGVRLEDMVLVTSDGCEILTNWSKKLSDNIIDI